MINRYNYTKDIIREYQNAWWKNEFKIGNISMIATFIIAILLLIQRIQKGTVNIYAIFLVVMPILYFIMLPIKKNKAVKTEINRYNETYKNIDNIIEIKLNKKNDKIELKTAGGKTQVTYDKIKKYIETKNLIILLLKGDMTISLKKDAFVDGSEEECKNLLKEKIKFKNRFKRSKNV